MQQIEDKSFASTTTPHNREAEEAVIGSVLIDPACMDELEISSDDFYILRHRWIWDAFEFLRSENTSIDFLTVCSYLEKTGKLQEVGGSAYLTSLLNQVPSSLNAGDYARIVCDEAENRTYLAIANKIAQDVYNHTLDQATIIDMLIKAKKVKGGTGDLTEALRKMDDNVQERLADPKLVWGIPTGFKDFDVMTGGLHKQQTMLLIGPPGVGKTTLALQIGFDVCIEIKKHVAIYEMEMDTERVLQRGVYMMGGPSPRKLKSGFFEEVDYPKYTNALGVMHSNYLHICDEPMLTTTMLRADLARLRARYDIELIILDYMDLLGDTDGSNENERSRNRSKRFRSICREANVCGISIQSLNKAGIEKAVAEIQDMSGPAGNGYDADWIFTLSKDEHNDKLLHMTQIKGRDSEGKCSIDLVRNGLRFYSVKSEKIEPNKKKEQAEQVPYWNDD